MSHHGLPCWYELASHSQTTALGFYGPILGWSWSSVDMGTLTYHMAATQTGSVAGMWQVGAEVPLGWTTYFAVDDCDATAAQAVALGATQIVAPADIPGTGRFAVLSDPQGAGFALLQPLPDGQGGAFDAGRVGHGNWHEMICPNAKAALAFYGALFGWSVARSVDFGDMTYHVIAAQGMDIGGTFDADTAQAYWKPYFRVASVTAAMGQVVQLGGQVLRGPDAVPGGDHTLQIKDAEGALLALTGSI